MRGFAATCIPAALAAIACAACTADPPGLASDPCVLDQCDIAGSLDQLLEEIEDHRDPIAEFLRRSATASGTLEGNYRQVLDGMGEVLGCDPSTESSFVVLSNHGFVPKSIFTRCADDPQVASQFFAAIPSLREDESGARDLDPQTMHLSAWDEEAGTYRIYSTRPTADGDMGVGVSPRFCLGCHGGPEQLGYWQPLMNEMTNPWSNWNAEPGFTSQLFEEFLDPEIATGETYREVTDPSVLDSASELEPIIRAGLARVSASRLLERNGAADIDDALALVQPLFCDEIVNFVSEVHGSGTIRSSAAIDPSIASHYQALGHTETWPWRTDSDLRMSASPSQWESITQVPVRAQSTINAEIGLVSRGVLTPTQVLRIRAIDWTRPALSELRCGLFRTGEERIRAGAIDDAVAALATSATTADIVPIVYQELMKYHGDKGLVPLVPPDGSDLIAVADGNIPDNINALADGNFERFAETFSSFGQLIDDYTSSLDRIDLRILRDTRACRVVAEYSFAPIYADVTCN